MREFARRRRGTGDSRASASSRASANSLNSSFTSRLLGGNTDDEEEAPFDGGEENAGATTPGGSNYASSTGSGGDKPSGSDTHSDHSSSKHHALASRPSFDNPFRSSNFSSRNGGRRDRIGGGSFSDYAGDVSGSDGGGGYSAPDTGGGRYGQHGQRGRRSGARSGHSVSFSIEEADHSTIKEEASGVGSQGPHEGTQSSDTFSLGSLALMSASSRSSRASKSSKSSRSSRSSHGSAATASTHSSQERRRRRELVPVKQDRRKKAGGGSGAGNSSLGGSSFSGSGAGKFSTHHRRRKRASDASAGSSGSRNLYNRKGEEGAFGDLHDRHPVRYPKRSIEEGNESDDDEAPTNWPVRDVDLPSDEDGLFRRASRPKGEAKKQSTNEFLDGLIASTTRRKNPRYQSLLHPDSESGKRHEDGDAASVGESSFLSDLLASRRQSPRQRKKSGVGTNSSNASSLMDTTDTSSSAPLNIYKDKHGNAKGRWRSNESVGDAVDAVVLAWHKFRDSVRESPLFGKAEQWYEEGGDVLPKNRKEWAILAVIVVLLLPVLRVVVVHATGGGNVSGGSGISWSDTSGNGAVYGSLGSDATNQLSSDTWAGSAQVMLSRSSSLRENFILIPDADWIELQMGRERAALESGGKGSFLRKKRAKKAKPPQRIPLPSLIDQPNDFALSASTGRVVVFTLTGANGMDLPKSAVMTVDSSKLNRNANANMWTAIQNRLTPRPNDVWACYQHNSLARHREDGFALMYPYDARAEARRALKRLAREFGQSVIHEFVTSENHGGHELVPAKLSDGRSDVMIRRTISTSSAKGSSSSARNEPVVVMRRVRDLPVEDELSLREWEGPPLEEVTWTK
ncbi:hypothetical protein ACHAXT_010983 [Thalassiosira profunda]